MIKKAGVPAYSLLFNLKKIYNKILNNNYVEDFDL